MNFTNFVLQEFFMSQQQKGQTTLAERTMLVHMWLSGLSYKAIAEKTGMCATTVSRWVNRWRQEGHVNQRRCNRRRGSAHNHPSNFFQCHYDAPGQWQDNAPDFTSFNSQPYSQIPPVYASH